MVGTQGTLWIANVRHWRSGDGMNLLVRDGLVASTSVPNAMPPEGVSVLNGAGMIVAPAFVEPHYHMDKAFAEGTALPGGSLGEQLSAAGQAAAASSTDAITDRAIRVGRVLASRGVAAVRTFADVDKYVGIRSIEALLEAKLRLSGLIDIQVVAFTQHGLFTDPAVPALLDRALAMGVDGVGGHPQLEATIEDGHRQIERLCGLAREHGLPVDFHVDETDDPASSWLEPVVRGALAAGLAGRLSLAHCNSLAWKPATEQARLIDLLVLARANVVVSPTSGLLFRGQGVPNPPRGIAPVDALLKAGVRVCIGQEIYRSLFSQHLRFPDPLMSGQLLAYVSKMANKSQLRRVFTILTEQAAISLGLGHHGPEPGARADLVLLDSSSVEDSLTLPPGTRVLIKDGKVVARSEFRAQVLDPATQVLGQAPS